MMIARALFEALAQLHDVPADLPEGAVEFVAAPGEGRDEDGIENYPAFGAWHVRAGDEVWRAVEVDAVLDAEREHVRARRYQVWRDGDLDARWRAVRGEAGVRVWAGRACAEVDEPLSGEQVAELPGPVRTLIEALPEPGGG
ncbi:hypothetical protein [Buchananella felis]|uniref:hypothetical protein n=1 Tax=Buchananella felis TaxID=3231492 RepID=UPI003526EFCB